MLTVESTKAWIDAFSKKIMENKAYLSDLDTPIGDGDHGNNMARGVTAVETALTEKNPETVTDILKVTAMTLVSKVGGASGPLYGTAFLEMAKASKKTQEIVPLLEAGLAGIKKRGNSTAGEKTMIDCWEPAIAKLKSGALTNADVDGFVEATKDMVATKGRASYLGERSKGHLDPGAVSSSYLFKSLLEVGGDK